MRVPSEKIVAFSDLISHAKALRSQGRRLVTTNGCFDLLHLGHLNYLQEARLLGDCLWVGLNSDASVKRLKGAQRPLQTESVRALQLAALEAVDFVTVFGEDTPEAFLEGVRPFLHVKGGDYDVSRLPERHIVERGGGKVQCLSLTQGFSTTGLVEKIKNGGNFL
jgi:glycerol-3-phosphate cytidylyltransferase